MRVSICIELNGHPEMCADEQIHHSEMEPKLAFRSVIYGIS